MDSTGGGEAAGGGDPWMRKEEEEEETQEQRDLLVGDGSHCDIPIQEASKLLAKLFNDGTNTTIVDSDKLLLESEEYATQVGKAEEHATQVGNAEEESATEAGGKAQEGRSKLLCVAADQGYLPKEIQPAIRRLLPKGKKHKKVDGEILQQQLRLNVLSKRDKLFNDCTNMVDSDKLLLESAEYATQVGKAEESVTVASGKESVTEDSNGGLLKINSACREFSTPKEANEVAEEIRKIMQQIAMLGNKEEFAKKEAALLLAGMYSTGVRSSMRKQAEEEAGNKSEMLQQRRAEEDMLDCFMRLPPERCQRALKQYYAMKHEAAEWKALVAKEEKRKALLASQEKSARREKAKGKALKQYYAMKHEAAKQKALVAEEEKRKALLTSQEKSTRREKAKANAKVNEEAGKTEASVTESGRPEESMAEAGKAEEAVAEVGNRQKVMGKETLQQLCKDMPNKFDILDLDGDDEKDEIDRGKSAIEEEHMPSSGMNPSDRGEESVTVGSGKSGMDKQDVMGKETVHAEEPTAPVPEFYSGMTPEFREELMKHNEKRRSKREAMLASFGFLCQSNSGNSAGAGDSLIPADPSATQSMVKYSVQGDLDHDRGKSDTALAKKTAARKETAEAKAFALHRTAWESNWSKTCGQFSQSTVLSSMQFTHYTPGLTAHRSFCSTPQTLQIFSIKLTGLGGGLKFPLSVYGTVAVRDIVDRNRNILFSRDYSDCQELKQNDPFLHLIGPSRAIVFTERVCIEIELGVVAGSQNKALISCARYYSGGHDTMCLKNRFCTLELSSQRVKQTVQATILGVQVLDYNGSWPFKYGGLVACSPLSGELVITDDSFGRKIDSSSGSPIVLVHSKHEAVPKGKRGFVHLWRQVVSVEFQGRLDFDIKSYSKSGATAAEASACFLPKACNISQRTCLLGDAEVTITVAWSRVATCKAEVA